jgi:hypothetical protein
LPHTGCSLPPCSSIHLFTACTLQEGRFQAIICRIRWCQAFPFHPIPRYALGEALPGGSDPQLLDWMADVMEEAAASAGLPPNSRLQSAALHAGGLAHQPPPPSPPPIGLTTAHAYSTALGYFVALDGAVRITRPLPTAGLISYAPPGVSKHVLRQAGRQAGRRGICSP